MAKWFVKDQGSGRRSGWIALLAPTSLPVVIMVSTMAMTPTGTPVGPSAAPSYKSDAPAAHTAQPVSEAKASFLRATAKIPAFARKYGLPCSACHTIWPQLNAFGQKFKDNGYQLGNDRDAPIWISPAYWPIAMRTTPQWHYESTTNQLVDGSCGTTCESTTLSQSGFDISGIDFLALGTLYKNITFGLVPTLDPDGTAGIETAFVRFDNLGDNTWVNIKMGKFELDNLLSEKRILTLSNNGGFYVNYHFVPVNDGVQFGLGDNQIGAEWMGHSANSYSRMSFAILSSTDGNPGLPPGHAYGAMFTASQAFDTRTLGPQRVGVFGYMGQQPTVFKTDGGTPVAGGSSENKSYYRAGILADLFFGNFMVTPYFMHGEDNSAFTASPAVTQNPTWNSWLIQAEYLADERLVFLARYEDLKMQQQADPTNMPKTLGNTTQFVFGIRSYPFMWSRTGLAMHLEYAMTKTIGAAPMSGDGTGNPPLTLTTPVSSSSIMLGLDFAF